MSCRLWTERGDRRKIPQISHQRCAHNGDMQQSPSLPFRTPLPPLRSLFLCSTIETRSVSEFIPRTANTRAIDRLARLSWEVARAHSPGEMRHNAPLISGAQNKFMVPAKVLVKTRREIRSFLNKKVNIKCPLSLTRLHRDKS